MSLCQLLIALLADVPTHRRILARMLALPPVEIMQIAAELQGRRFGSDNRQSFRKSCAADMAGSACDLLGFDCAMPRNAPVTALIETRGIDRALRIATARMPVLAVCPMVGKYLESADLTKRRDALIRRRISPDTAIPTVEAARAAIIRSAVGQANLLKSEAAL